MRNLTFTLLLLLAGSFAGNAQTTVFLEDFETVPSTLTSSSGTPGWFTNTRLQVSGLNCDSSNIVAPGSVSYLTTIPFSTMGNSYVTLTFNHICKADFFDGGVIQVSTNGGVTWTSLIDNVGNPGGLNNCNYLGASTGFGNQGSKFQEVSYGTWLPGDSCAVPTNSWWMPEEFDISALTGNQPDVRIRFRFTDNNNNGNSCRAGWFVDDVKVVIAPCELVLPTLAQDAPFYPTNVYNLGPFTINATATDLSGISSITLYYSVNGGTFVAVPMTSTTGNSYTASIPAVNDLDQICYYIEAIDNSGCSNTTYSPGPTAANTVCFTANQGITFPYCDYFDIPGIPWSGSGATAGTTWQLGVPASGVLNSAYSAPNAWVTNLTSPYGANADASLVTPEMSFTTGAGATLEFWQYRNTQLGLDGFKLQWATNVNGPWTTLGAVGCANCVNWYTDAALTDGQPGWEGNSGGWVKSSIILDATFNNLPQVWFRFHFVSNAATQSDGVAIDNFCIFLPDSNDVGVTVIDAPASSSPAGVCADVVVTVKNHGINPQTNFPVTYLTSTGLTGTANYSGPPIAPGATVQVTIPCFIIPVGPFSICAWTDLAIDGNNFNDTTCANSFGTPIYPVAQGSPYFDNFNTGATGWSGQNASGAPLTQWELGAPTFGATSSSYSPPNCWDVNLSSAYGNNASCELLSPLFDFSQAVNPYMTFWINHLCEAAWDGTRLDYRIGGGPWTMLGGANLTAPCWVNWYNSTPNINATGQPAWMGASNGWKKVEANCLPATFNNQPLPIQFRFVFASDPSVLQDGFSIDDFTIAMPEPNDVGVVSIDQPASSSPAGTCADVVVTIKNHGTLPQTGFPVTYLTSTGLTGTANYTGPAIAPGASTQLTLPCFIVPVGNFGICAWTDLSTDANHYNDTNCTNSFGTPIYTVSQGNAYFDNFNTGATGWSAQNPTGTPVTQWELGAPTYGATSSSYSPPSCWDVNLNSAYGGNAACELLSPLFDFSQAVNAYMTFWINHNCEATYDGTRLEYRIGGGAWNLLGAANLTAPCWLNWYNSTPNIWSSNQPAWMAASNGWKKVEALCLPATFNNQTLPVQFRFVFTADGVVNQDGFSIDDFTIALPEPDDVGVVSIDQPTGSSPAGNTIDVILTVKNFGTNPQTTFPVTYVETSPGAQTGTVTYNGNLLPGATTQITIPGFVVPSGGFNLCAWTDLTNDGNHFNDTLCGASVGIPLIAVTYTAPFEDDFNGVNIGWSTANPSGTPITQWELGAPAYGATSNCFSPPNCWDVNLLSAYGNSAACELLTPMFDFSQAVDAKISFWRNHNCETGWDGTRIDYRIGNQPWTILGAANLTAPCWVNWYNSTPNINATNQPAWMGASGGWVKAEATCLPAVFNNQTQPVQFRFLFASDPSVIQDGFSIDDFKIQIPVPLTAAPIVVNTNTVNNSFIFPGQSVQFSSPISNPGTTPLTSVIATLTINGVPFTTDTIYYNPALPAAQNLLHTFLQNWTAGPGVYDVCVITSEPNFGIDLNPFDDTTCITISVFDTVSVTSTSSYCTDFESGPQWVSANAVTLNSTLCSWQLGTPAQTQINSASSGQNAWMTNLSTNYPNRDTSALFTPVFAIDTTKCYRITFNHIFKTEPWQDGGVLEFSNDYAATWHHVGVTTANNPSWYNTAFITALGGLPPLPGWSGTQSTWQQALLDFQFWGSNTIMLRFRFASDNTVNSEGWAIDDFCLEEIPGFCVVSVPEVIGDGLILGQNQPNPFSESTSIHFALPNAGQTKLYVTDVLGREVMTLVDDRLESGTHSYEINGKTLNAGIYYYTLEFDGHEITRKMVLTR